MKTILLVVGRTTDKHFLASIEEYVSRVNHYMPFSIEVIPELKDTKKLSEQEQKQRESELIQKTLQPSDYLVLLDEHGTEYRSVEFAQWIQKKLASSPRRLIFLVGGPYGFANNIYEIAKEKISISKMTFSHQMRRF